VCCNVAYFPNYIVNMRSLTFALACIVSAFPCAAQTIDAPVIKAGDTWVYRMTDERAPNGWNQRREELTVNRVTASTIYYEIKQSGSTQPSREVITGRDWSHIRNVNGKETIVNRPLFFPLAVGKSWDFQFSEQNPNKTYKWTQHDAKFVVAGVEPIVVPAGKFNALKIEAEGHWSGELAPTQTVVQGAQSSQSGTTMVTDMRTTLPDTRVTGRSYRAYWYVPEIKRWVKSVEEHYNTSGIRSSRYMMELESFKAVE
jgi:hypothetical protein